MELKIKGYRVRRYEPEYHNSDDWDFVSVKKRLESLGYTATIYKRTSLSASYVFNKANSVFLTLKDGDDIIGEFEMHDLILNYTGKQRLTEQQIEKMI